MVTDFAFRAELMASDYESIMGNGANLNVWIASSLAKITSLTEAELLAELNRTDRLGMLSLCSPEALRILIDEIFKHMNSGRVRDRLREIQSCPIKSLEIYGPSKIHAANFISEDFEYVEPEPIEPAIEFVDIDPETQAEILRSMRIAA